MLVRLLAERVPGLTPHVRVGQAEGDEQGEQASDDEQHLITSWDGTFTGPNWS